jgi:hypothetical protein
VGGDPFYVGRTIDMTRRLNEHKYSSKKGTECKYQKIRELESLGHLWEMIPLTTVKAEEKNYEDFWVYTLICAGYQLTNMRAGDSVRAGDTLQLADKTAMLVMRGNNLSYENAEQFLSAREQLKAEQAAQRKAERLREKTLRQENQEDKHKHEVGESIFVGEDPNKKFISSGLKSILERKKT